MAVVEGDTLSDAELVALVEGPAVYVDAGCDLLDEDDHLIEEITEDFVSDGSSVERGIYRTIHGTATLNISRELAWGSQRLRPYLLLSDDRVTWYRWNLGVFLPTVPERVVGDDPPVWSVQAMDKLDILNTPAGAAFSVSGGANVVSKVTALIEAAGETAINIDPSSKTAGSARVYSMADGWTELGIINDLLDAIGFRALWVDRDGVYRSEPYRAPADLPVVWDYSTASGTTTVAEDRTSIADYYLAANEIVGVRDVVADALPADGAGLYTATNQTDGLTSIAARGGRTIRRTVTGQFADHAALVTAVDAALDTEKRVANYVNINVSPTPVHGHFDVVNYRDDAIAVNGRMVVTDYTLPLDGSDCSLFLRAI